MWPTNCYRIRSLTHPPIRKPPPPIPHPPESSSHLDTNVFKTIEASSPQYKCLLLTAKFLPLDKTYCRQVKDPHFDFSSVHFLDRLGRRGGGWGGGGGHEERSSSSCCFFAGDPCEQFWYGPHLPRPMSHFNLKKNKKRRKNCTVCCRQLKDRHFDKL